MSGGKRPAMQQGAGKVKLSAYLQTLLPGYFEDYGFLTNRYTSPQDYDRSRESGDEFERDIYATLRELESLSGSIEFDLGDCVTCRPVMRHVPFPEEEYASEEGGEGHPETRDGERFELLKIETSVANPYEGFETLEEYQYLAFVRRSFEKRIHDLVLAANIARPGSLEVKQGVVYSGGQEHPFGQMGKGGLLRGARVLSALVGWPEIRSLDIAAVWEWANRQDGFVGGFGGGAYGQGAQRLRTPVRPRHPRRRPEPFLGPRRDRGPLHGRAGLPPAAGQGEESDLPRQAGDPPQEAD